MSADDLARAIGLLEEEGFATALIERDVSVPEGLSLDADEVALLQAVVQEDVGEEVVAFDWSSSGMLRAASYIQGNIVDPGVHANFSGMMNSRYGHITTVLGAG